MTDLAQRKTVLALLDEALDNGSRLEPRCEVIGLAPSTVRRWLRPGTENVLADKRPNAPRPAPHNRYSEAERDRVYQQASARNPQRWRGNTRNYLDIYRLEQLDNESQGVRLCAQRTSRAQLTANS